MATDNIDRIKDKKIFYGVLNWGLGHASRSIILIRKLAEKNEVILASDGEAGELLRAEFPNLPYKDLPSYDIHYKYSSMHINMLVQAPKIIITFKKEMSRVKKYVLEMQPDIIISDHRYGFRADYIKSIFIGHQLNILSSPSATTLNKMLINKFSECWVPDYADRKLSGELSNTRSITNFKFIGPLSRMRKLENDDKVKGYDITAVLSGPEPRRSYLEKLLIPQFLSSGLRVCLVRGINSQKSLELKGVDVIDMATTKELNEIMSASKMIVCRSGYSSIMDLETIKLSALLIPTKGQIEQEYLGKHLANKANYLVQSEDEISVLDAFSKLVNE